MTIHVTGHSRWATLAVCGVVLLGAFTGACAGAQARVTVEPPALEVPLAPPRNVEPILAADAGPIEPAPDPVEANVKPPAQPARPGPARPRPEPEPPADAAATNAVAPPVPTSTLQTIPSDRESQVQRSVRASLDGAIANLNRVEYQRLGADARANFDQARRFIAQAEEALRARNLVFAATVADKAVTLAAQLAGL